MKEIAQIFIFNLWLLANVLNLSDLSANYCDRKLYLSFFFFFFVIFGQNLNKGHAMCPVKFSTGYRTE